MTTCPQCGKEFECIGIHWLRSQQCHYPHFTQHQKEIIIGLLMGDGTLEEHYQDTSSRLKVDMITPNYLKLLRDKFGVLSTKVKLRTTAKKQSEQDDQSGFNEGACEDDYHDVYRWRIRSHPELNEFDSWYESGKKVWPASITLTPTVLKHYFVCDGTRKMYTTTTNRQESIIKIAMSNERENKGKVNYIFKNSNLPAPNNWYEGFRQDGTKTCSAVWNVENSKELFQYMGQPLPSFEYKWPSDFTN